MTRSLNLACARASSVTDPTTTHLNPRALHNNGVSLTKTPMFYTDARDLYFAHFQDQIYTHIASKDGRCRGNQTLTSSQASTEEKSKPAIHLL